LGGDRAEFQHRATLAQDGDLLIAGVPGSGRRTLVSIRNGSDRAGGGLHPEPQMVSDLLQLLCDAISPLLPAAVNN